ncbi:glycoside hydrolase family 13 protein [Caloramator proteoclasticus]|uniref:Oligo-1,6-glucosidase n=1 Tax=Caloramator proteoclasticus DSM 10124 TaxID=1121262 RepID=A0A1M4YJ45_9CLOT|nr:alpha-glucosidase [Caloramator proteoclasticus]SHF05759.1 oligo-1,6-glucosidase [Caloramator proteoclasticus DSM 10124]
MKRAWWKEGVAYQIYVRSFKDTNGDGIGDLRGIIEKLDYLKHLGVDMIYLNPINKSPNDDNGYDISDYYDIMDEFGTMEDFKLLIQEMHKRDMKLIMDLVINHTSDEHPWFVESRKSKDNPYRDYYIWHPGKNGNPPNNWGSFFGGSAWEYDEQSGEYYLHLFSKKMPDLNWRCEDVRNEIIKMIQFWIDLGVDGFRFDAINHLEKDFNFPDAEIKEGQVYGDFIKYVQNLPKVHDYIKEIRRRVFNTGYHVLIGETGGISYHNAYLYTGVDREELDMTFHFDMHSVGKGERDWERRKIDLVKEIKEKMSGWQMRYEKEGWCPIFYSNHDSTRTVSRLGDDKKYHKESAKMLATLQLTQKGTPFIYYGDEIGMTNAWDFELEDYRDVAVFNKYRDFVESGLVSHENYIKGLHLTSRDNARTPMQWDDSKNAGFSETTPWIRVNSNYKDINVKAQIKDEDSILNYYRRLIELRKNNLTLVYGDFIEINREHEEIYSYIRKGEDDAFLVVVNFFSGTPEFKLPEDVEIKEAKLILSNYNCGDENINNITLRPYEARIYKIKL